MRGPRACVRALATCFLSSRFHRPVLPQVLRLAIAQPVAGIDAHASMIIAVPAPVGGLVVLARTSVAYVPGDALSGAARRVIPGNAAESIYDIMARCALSEEDEIALKEYVESFEKMLIDNTMRRHKGSISAVMDELCLPRRTLNEKMAKYGLTRSDYV